MHFSLLLQCREYSKNEENITAQLSEDEWNNKFIGWFKQKVSDYIFINYLVLKKIICSRYLHFHLFVG